MHLREGLGLGSNIIQSNCMDCPGLALGRHQCPLHGNIWQTSLHTYSETALVYEGWPRLFQVLTVNKENSSSLIIYFCSSYARWNSLSPTTKPTKNSHVTGSVPVNKMAISLLWGRCVILTQQHRNRSKVGHHKAHKKDTIGLHIVLILENIETLISSHGSYAITTAITNCPQQK